MPKVVLEFEVTDKGLAGVPRLLTETSTALAKLKTNATQANAALASTDTNRANVSFRELKQTVGALTLSLAGQNPQVAAAGFQFASFGRMLSGLPGPYKAVAAAAVYTTAVLVTQMSRVNELRERYATLNRAVLEMDFSALRQGMRETSIEMGRAVDQEDTVIGFLENLGRTLLFLPTKYEAAREKMEDYRKTLEELLPIEQKLAELQFRQQRGGLAVSAVEALAGRLEGAGRLDVQAITTLAAQQRQILKDMERDAIAIAEQQALRERGLAVFRHASAKELGEIDKKLAREKILIHERTALQVDQMESRNAARIKQIHEKLAADKTQALDKYVSALRDVLGKATAQYEKHAEEVKRIDKEMRASRMDTGDILAGIKQAGMTPAEAFADREKRAQEKLAVAMQLSGQDQVDALKKVQQEYAALALEAARARASQQAAASADPWAAQRRAQYWWLPENQQAKPLGDLDALTQKVKEVGDKIGEAFQKMKDEADASAKAAKRIVDETERNLRAVQESTQSVYQLRDAYLAAAAAARSIPRPPTHGGGGGGAGAGGGQLRDPWDITTMVRPGVDFSRVGTGEIGEPIIVVGGEGGFFAGGDGGGGDVQSFRHGGVVPRFQHGGFVPNFLGFPAGSPAGSMPSGFAPMRPWGPQNAIDRVYPGMTGGVPIIAEPGELILNQAQQGNVAAWLNRSIEVTIQVFVAGHDVARAIVPDLEQAIANGQLRLRAG